jgi:outer membrane protein assembly factor BamB
MLKNNTKFRIAIAFCLAILVVTSMMLMPNVSSHTPSLQIPTYAFINVSPNPAGIGQKVLINMWINDAPPTANDKYGDRWENFTVAVTKPDGTAQVLGPFTSDAAGATTTNFTPTTLGNYTFVFAFSGQTITGPNPAPYGTMNPEYIGDYYQPSTSSKYTLQVQEQATETYPNTPLPTTYWDRPINAENSQWYSLSGNWLGLMSFTFDTPGYNATSSCNPFTTAPNTPHIMWTKSVAAGGVIGGEFGGTEKSNFYSTSQYEPKFMPVIMNGVLYYTQFPGASTNPTGWTAVDLRSGRTIWNQNITETLVTGQILNFESPNQFGGIPYLWGQSGSTYSLYDAFTGNWILDIVDSPALTLATDSSGNLLGYYINQTDNTLNLWNSTLAITQDAYSWYWHPSQGAAIPFSYGIEWTVPIVHGISSNIGLGFTPIALIGTIWSSATFTSNVLVLTNIPFTPQQAGPIVKAGYDMYTGQLLWGPINETITPYTAVTIGGADNGVFTEYTQETGSYSGFSATTGKQLWGPVKVFTDSWSYYGSTSVGANGYLYAFDVAGYVVALNITTGAIEWTWNTGSSGTETPYNTWPLWLYVLPTIADGKIYLCGGAEYNQPLFHGSQLYCLNATSGQKIWSILSFDVTKSPAIADGYMLALNAYDNQIYTYGKGPSRLTVTAPSVSVTTNTPITISGTITDVSADASQQAVAANFPNGLPCVSDTSMRSFMEAVYMQQTMPNNITGVPIALNVVDSNGNYRTIGTATSNNLGTYSYTWTPDISGDYTVYASFEGSDSYYGSNAAAAFHASEPAATPMPQPTQAQSMADQYFLPATVGLFVLIIIVLVMLAVVMMRKRP